jgi:RNA-directed DNA polymerase
VMERIGLTLNDAKTSIRNARTESFDFLGYTFGPDHYRRNGHWYLAAKPSRKSVQRAKTAVRAALRPGNHDRWPEVAADLNRRLRGWATYFNYGTRVLAYRAIDHYVADAVQHFLRRRHKVPTRGTRRFGAQHVIGELGVLRLESRVVRSAV